MKPGARLQKILRKLSASRRPLAAILLSLGLAASALLLPLLSQPAQFEGRNIEGIEFVGLRNVTANELYEVLSSQIGQPLQPENYNRDVRALFRTGYFAEVEMRARLVGDDGVELIFLVEELPRVDDIRFLGVEELAVQDLKQLLDFKEFEVFNLQLVKQGRAAIEQKYRSEGFFLAEVWYRIGKTDDSNQIVVNYIVDEGENIPITKINLLGVKKLDAEDILGVMDQTEEGLLEDGIFQESKFEEDKFKILAYAKSEGFLDAEIDPRATDYEIRWRNANQPEEGRVVVVTYKLIEGEKKYFGGYSLEHDPEALNEEFNPPERVITDPEEQLTPIFEPDQLIQRLEFQKGDLGEVFDEGRYFRDRGFLQEAYSTQGYVFAQIQPYTVNFTLDGETLDRYEACAGIANPVSAEERRCKREAEWLDLETLRTRLEENPEEAGNTLRHVHFVVRENGLAYIENIIIKGHEKTQENVIRRELLVKEGQLFNSALVNRSREKLINLQYFKEVNLQMRPGSTDDQMNLVIEVKEQPTGTISMGGGYGTISGFSIFTEVSENNLNGTGQRVTGRLEYGPLRRTLGLEWSDPWFYEACEDSTGRFWRKKMEAFDGAESVLDVLQIAGDFQNEYSELGKVIRSYVEETGENPSVEEFDRLKVRIRNLIRPWVEEETECYRSFPRPWALRLGAFYQSVIFQDVSPLAISFDQNDLFEESSFERNRLGLEVGTSHSFLVNWAHYHVYSPSWSIASRPTSLVNDNVLQEVDLGWQFKSSFTNGVVYNTIDNVFNPTEGFRTNLSIQTVGGILGGQDHFNRYRAEFDYYFWWFDYTFGGLIRRNFLKRWRVVQSLQVRGAFTHETGPYGGGQDKEKNPFIEPEDRLFLGGYETLRGYNFNSRLFPALWQDGGSHRLLATAELRFPIEPSLLWFTFFFDAGALYDNLGEFTGDLKEDVEAYDEVQRIARARSDPLLSALIDSRDPSSLFANRYHFDSLLDWNDPSRTVFSMRNVALNRGLYSWGLGFRVQIPVLPLRLYVAQKLYYAGAGQFKPIPGNDEFEFVFGIGDQRF